jgi:hypothetical protein
MMDNCRATTEKKEVTANDRDPRTSLTGARKLPQYTAAIIGE